MRVAITGHRPDAFIQSHYTENRLSLIVGGTIATFQREYGDDLIFNLGGAVGADQWVGDACIEQGVKFHLYLPMLPEVQSKYWSSVQQSNLEKQMAAAAGVTIYDPSGKYDVATYHMRDRKMVDNADIVVAFWVGKKKGGTYNTMKYALGQSKFVLNALNSLRPVFSDDLKTGWTPPRSEQE